MSEHVHCSTLPRCSGTYATAAQISSVLEWETSSWRYDGSCVVSSLMGCPQLAVPEQSEFLQLGHHLLRWQQQACRSQAPLLPEALIGMLRSSLVTDVAIAAHACVPGGLAAIFFL